MDYLKEIIDANRSSKEPYLDLGDFQVKEDWHVKKEIPKEVFTLKHLKSLKIPAPRVYISDNIEALEGLESIYARWLFEIGNIKALSRLPKLNQLELSYANPRVKYLDSHFPALSLEGLESDSLSFLDIHYSVDIKLDNMCLPNLEWVEATGVGIENLDFLMACPKLKHLIVNCNEALNDLTGLKHVPDLTELELYDCHDISELESLRGLEKLKMIYLPNHLNIPKWLQLRLDHNNRTPNQ